VLYCLGSSRTVLLSGTRLCVVPYTTIVTFRQLSRDTWEANASAGVVEVSKRNGVWRGRWPDGRWIEIPGGRDLYVYESTANATTERRKMGRRYQTINRARAETLPPLASWCTATAERSVHDGAAFWLDWDVWQTRSQDPLPIPFIPELDEPGDDLQRLARAERACREAADWLDEAHVERGEALIGATRNRRSRRRLAEGTGLSFGRVHQLVKRAEARRAAARARFPWIPLADAVKRREY
jgi:hypothetical protein